MMCYSGESETLRVVALGCLELAQAVQTELVHVPGHLSFLLSVRLYTSSVSTAQRLCDQYT